MPLTDRMLWCDTETFGLDPNTDPILELGFRITDLNLVLIDEHSWLVCTSPLYDELFFALKKKAAQGDETALYVYNMHTKNDLWDDAFGEGITPTQVEEEACHWLASHGLSKGDPLCGSSVHFDRGMLDAQMPKITEMLSYRNIDVSTLKELATGYNPAVVQIGKGREIHRVLPDLEDSVAEFKHYLDNFLLEG